MENKFLIDTHIFIWSMEKNKILSQKIFSILKNPQNSIYISVASIWEIIIKTGKKKLKSPDDFEKVINSVGFNIIPIKLDHVLAIKSLPHFHTDPFDRLLIAQAQVENLTLISSDPKIAKYKINLLQA